MQRRSGTSWLTVWTAYTALGVSATNINESYRDSTSPWASSYLMSGTTAVTTTGGTGTPTKTFTYVSGDTAITHNGNGNFSATVPANNTYTAVWRVTVDDGVSTASTTFSISLEYATGIIQ